MAVHLEEYGHTDHHPRYLEEHHPDFCPYEHLPVILNTHQKREKQAVYDNKQRGKAIHLQPYNVTHPRAEGSEQTRRIIAIGKSKANEPGRKEVNIGFAVDLKVNFVFLGLSVTVFSFFHVMYVDNI